MTLTSISGNINPNEKPMKNSKVFHELCIAFFIGAAT